MADGTTKLQDDMDPQEHVQDLESGLLCGSMHMNGCGWYNHTRRRPLAECNYSF